MNVPIGSLLPFINVRSYTDAGAGAAVERFDGRVPRGYYRLYLKISAATSGVARVFEIRTGELGSSAFMLRRESSNDKGGGGTRTSRSAD